ncbi:putative SNARE complex subunit [Aspergillus granulosus]|uniref:SNARE complex subunit n=1 Tax=Aspergillus granulosus TaxID=176169 RepID=A0ABR4H4N2_9EURO
MAPPLEISIPTTTTSTTSPPYTIYNILLRLPLRSFALEKRYSDFTTFHTTLTSQTNTPPPTPLPPKSWFSNTISNTTLRESRRQGLESYLRAINESDDPRWRNSPAWRAFLNLPSLGPAHVKNGTLSENTSANGNGNGNGVAASSARLHAAITGPGIGGNGEPIRDPTLWLDCYRDLKSHLHDARLHLTRRDQETTPQRQHESSARAKSSLVRVGTLITALDEGLKSSSGSGHSRINGESSSNSLGEGELRRRRDLLINARKEKDGLEDLLNAMAAKSRIDNAVASVKDREALLSQGASGAGRKPAARSGRVLGKETDKTRELDNQGVLQLQRDMIQEQDMSMAELIKVIRRQKELGIRINEELEIQNEMLRMVDEDTDRVTKKMEIAKKRVGKIS